MSGAVPPLSQYALWRVAQLKAQGLYLYIIKIFILQTVTATRQLEASSPVIS